MKLTACVIAFAAALLVAACSKKAQESAQTGNPAFKVDFLFEHEGCKVFRFEDGGKNRYFTTCQGEVSWSDTYPCGKGCSKTETFENPTRRSKKP